MGVQLASVACVRALEASYRDVLGLPLFALMEAAGGAVAARVLRERPSQVLILCGKGNNGGDGLIVARRLLEAGVSAPPIVRLAGRIRDFKGDADLAAKAFVAAGGDVRENALGLKLPSGVGTSTVVVDALLGTGVTRAPEGDIAKGIQRVIDARSLGAKVVAVDVPSGLDADTGHAPGLVVRADVTVTFAPLKIGLVLDGALDLVGELDVIDIGVPWAHRPNSSEHLARSKSDANDEPELETVDADELGRSVGRRPRASFKNTFGHVLVLGGSPGMGGALALSAMAALRAGAGLVTVCSRQAEVRAALAFAPELMNHVLPGEGPLGPEDLDAIRAALVGKQVLVAGMGLVFERDRGRAFVLELVRHSTASKVPMVLDAGALSVLGSQTAPLGPEVVITPHPGEASRLLGRDSKQIQANRVASVLDLVKQTGGAVSVLKGAHSLIGTQDATGANGKGRARVRINRGGSAQLATAGSGDVLAGVIGAMLGRKGLSRFDAASLGVALHSRLGERHPERASLTATDLIRDLPEVCHEAGL
jgi:NAD(P)H-hydrate epimerase